MEDPGKMKKISKEVPVLVNKATDFGSVVAKPKEAVLPCESHIRMHLVLLQAFSMLCRTGLLLHS